MNRKRILPHTIAVVIMLFSTLLYLNGCYPAGMGQAIEKAEVLKSPDNIVAVYFDVVNSEKYLTMTNALDRMTNEDFDIERIFCIEGSKCWFAARRYTDDDSKLLIMSVSTNGKDAKVIGEFDSEEDSNNDRYYGEAQYLQYKGTDVEYSKLEAFYYNGKIVVNSHGTVTEIDLRIGTERTFDPDGYAFPGIETRLFIEDGDMLRVVRGDEEYSLTFAELLEASPEMRFLYELSESEGYPELEKHRFLYSVVYYNAEPYLVFNPISKGGESFGALFKYEPESRSFMYIDCVYTSGQPHRVYPAFVN